MPEISHQQQESLRRDKSVGWSLFGLFLGIAFLFWSYSQPWSGFGESTTVTRSTVDSFGTTTTTVQIQPAKTLWDWMTVAGVPVGLAVAAYLFSRADRDKERRIAATQEMDNVLQAYLDFMKDLLLEKGLRESAPHSEIRNIAHVRTVMTMHRLDSWHNQQLLDYLLYSEIMGTDTPDIVSLRGSDLRGVNLRDAFLLRYNLVSVDFRDADLSGATLTAADLTGAKLATARLVNAELDFAKLYGADLEGADLSGADLQYAILEGASVKTEQLEKARIYEGALLPDGTRKGQKAKSSD